MERRKRRDGEKRRKIREKYLLVFAEVILFSIRVLLLNDFILSVNIKKYNPISNTILQS
jgi:hypothetical protein